MPAAQQRSRSSRAPLLALGVLALLALGAVAAWFYVHSPETPGGAPRDAGRTNVLLVTIDTLRADRTGGRLTPSLNALAARGTRFLNARSPVPLTLPAHASLMTGLLPPRHGVRMNGVHRLSPAVPTLATTLDAAGYQTGTIVGAYVLDRRFGLARGFDTYDAEIPRREEIAGELEAERRGDVVADRAIAWLKGRHPDAPFFLWMHLYDPHAPYEPPASWLERAGGQRYDGEVAYADAQLGRVIDALQASGQADRTLVVVTGDHGESLGEHGEPTHGLLVYEGAVRIPLVVAGPGVPRAERADAASLVDVAAHRVAAAWFANQPQPATDVICWPGKPRTRKQRSTWKRTTPTPRGSRRLRALVAGRWKYIGGAEPAELYDLSADPSERRDVSGAHRAMVDAMAQRVRAIDRRRGPVHHRRPLAGGGRAPARARLRGLRPRERLEPGAARPSPRLLVAVWPAFQGALGDMAGGRHRPSRAGPCRARARLPRLAALPEQLRPRAGRGRSKPRGPRRVPRAPSRGGPRTRRCSRARRPPRAAPGLPDEALKAEQAVLAIDPTDAAAENGIGLLHADQGRAGAARDAFRRAIALDPHVVSYWVNLGNACRAAGQARRGRRRVSPGALLDEASVDAMNGIGVLLVQAGRAGEAAGWFERAVAASPEFYEAWLNLGIARQEQGERAAAAAAYRRVLSAPARYERERSAARQLLGSLGAR